MTSYQQARASIAKPPDDPAFWDVVTWALSGSDPIALTAAVVAGLGTLATFYQIVFDDPYTAAQGRKDRAHQNASLEKLDARTQRAFQDANEDRESKYAADMRGHAATQEQIAALVENFQRIADSSQTKGYEVDIHIKIRPSS